MANFTILTDSSCNLPDHIIDELGLVILPLRYMSGEEEYPAYDPQAPTDLKAFYENMRKGVVYTTSLPYQNTSIDTIRSLFEAGEDILYVGFSSALSGTYESTESILVDLLKEYPERKAYYIDTCAAALGEGLLVLHAAHLRSLGKSIEEVHASIVEKRFNVGSWFTVDDLVYLYRGGRVSRTSATAGNILSIKPILQVSNEGRLIPMEKVRGRKHSIQALFDHLKKTYEPSIEPHYIGISHGDCIEDAQVLVELIQGDATFADCEIIVNQLDPVIGSHSGPGTMSVFYWAESRD